MGTSTPFLNLQLARERAVRVWRENLSLTPDSGILCPYCLRETYVLAPATYRGGRPVAASLADGTTTLPCASCTRAIPLPYLDAFDRGQTVPLACVGLPGHGKTAYLTGLAATLRRLPQLSEAWAAFTATPLATSERQDDGSGQAPGLGLELLSLRAMPAFGDRTLVLYDVPGSELAAAPPSLPGPEIRAAAGTGGAAHGAAGSEPRSAEPPGAQDRSASADLAAARLGSAVLWCISLPTLLRTAPGGRAPAAQYCDTVLQEALRRYRAALTVGMGRPEEQRLVVVLTHVDQVRFPPGGRGAPLQEYVAGGGLPGLHHFGQHPWEYLSEAQSTSREIERLLDGEVGLRGFIEEADGAFASVRYAAIVSPRGRTGNGQQGGHGEPDLPLRVLDPLLWALDASSGWGDRIGRGVAAAAGRAGTLWRRDRVTNEGGRE